MSDFFSDLALPVSLSLSVEEIEESWSVRTKQSHPDSSEGGDLDLTTRLHQARSVLLDPVLRLEHWLLCKGAVGEKKGVRSLAAIDGNLMDLFTRMNEATLRADQAITALLAATTALGKAIHTNEALAAQTGLQTLLAEIKTLTEESTACFPSYEENAHAEDDFSDAMEALGRLKYLRKWERECGDRLATLISL